MQGDPEPLRKRREGDRRTDRPGERAASAIGASSTIGNHVLPVVITDFKKTHPKIKIHLLVGNTKRVVELLNSGNIDLGLVEGEVTRQKMIGGKILSTNWFLLSPSYHPGQKKEVSISELTKEPFIFREGGSGHASDD